MKHVTLYTKPGCHLCEAVEQVIATVQRQRPFTLDVVDILQDAGAERLYREAIPVVLIDGVERARYRLSVDELEAALDAAGR